MGRPLALASALCATLAVAGCAARSGIAPPPRATAKPTEYRAAALAAADWLLRQGRPAGGGGTWWPAIPVAKDEEQPPESLYSGSPGVVLFFLEAWRQTGDARYRDAARAGADHLLTLVDTLEDPGLYSGLAGVGYVLAETGARTGDARYTRGARRCVERLQATATANGDGVEWGKEPMSDVVGGNAGIGLFLLCPARELHMPQARELAARSGRRLLALGEKAEPAGRGMSWRLTPTFDRVYPNFAHGTAGVAYFLASLYRDTHERAFLDGALAGARYLAAVATPGEGDSCLIYRHAPDAKDLYYYAWCHGPAGTSRLFYRLYQITGDRSWLVWVNRLARGVLASGIPDAKRPGFWNVGACCGSAGVADFFLTLHRLTGEPRYHDFALRMAADLLARGTRDGDGLKWVQAENRVSPDEVYAQTGLMQGAAGIGLLLLRLDAYERGDRGAGFVLPDSPYGA